MKVKKLFTGRDRYRISVAGIKLFGFITEKWLTESYLTNGLFEPLQGAR